MKENIFCTLFDKNYLIQGLTLYKSLAKHSKDCSLYVLCMDDISYNLLNKIKATDLIPIPIENVEDGELLKMKEKTTRLQYCGVMQPVICRYILDTYDPKFVTYVDADIMFFSDPQVLLSELENKFVSLIPNRFAKEHDHLADRSGKYTVQFNTFYKNSNSQIVLDYWKKECFKYNKNNPYYFPGQLSLVNWIPNFNGIKEIDNIGAGVAPWNEGRYKLTSDGKKVHVDGNPVIFYHYHGFGWLEEGGYLNSFYTLSDDVVQHIYLPYIALLEKVEVWIKSIDPSFHYKKIISSSQGKKPTLTKILSSNIKWYLGKLNRILHQ